MKLSELIELLESIRIDHGDDLSITILTNGELIHEIGNIMYDDVEEDVLIEIH